MSSNKGETKRERFVRLANRRTNEVLERLRILGGCSNRRMYEYNEQDVGKMFRAIEGELKRVKQLFSEDRKKDFHLEV